MSELRDTNVNGDMNVTGSISAGGGKSKRGYQISL